MKFSEWSRLNTKELKYILKQNKIKNYSNMNKAELLKKIKEIHKQKGGEPKAGKLKPKNTKVEAPSPPPPPVPALNRMTMMSFTSGRFPMDSSALPPPPPPSLPSRQQQRNSNIPLPPRNTVASPPIASASSSAASTSVTKALTPPPPPGAAAAAPNPNPPATNLFAQLNSVIGQRTKYPGIEENRTMNQSSVFYTPNLSVKSNGSSVRSEINTRPINFQTILRLKQAEANANAQKKPKK